MSGPSSRRRLLLVIGKLGRAGAESQLAALALGLAERGDEVTIAELTPGMGRLEPLNEAGVRLAHFDTPAGIGRARVIGPLARLARRHDLVHCTMWDASLWGRLAAIAARRPVVVSDHSATRDHQVSRGGAPRERLIAAHNRLLEPATASTVACAQAQIPLLRSEGVRRIDYIPNGVSFADLRAPIGTGPTREQLGIPETAHAIIHVARFHPLKNQRLTLETTARLREAIGDVHVIFAGDGDERANVERQAMESGADWAHFVGRRKDVGALLELADIAVLPSLSEAMPMALVEAMAMGVPTVAFSVGDVGPTLDAAGAGVHVEPGDADAFFEACREVLVDSALRERLAQGARTGAEDYTVETMIARYSALFDRVLGR